MADKYRPFPWAAVMSFAYGVLRVPPAHFWAMTPREVADALKACGADDHSTMTAEDFAALRAQFPD